MTSVAMAAALAVIPPQPPTVFIVDDDLDVRRAISLLVRSVDLEAAPFSSAQEFLANYDAEKPGCLVLDVRMPGMTGLQLHQQMAAHAIRLPVIFVSAHGEIPTVASVIRAGAVDFIPKPFSPQTLLERIHEAISIDWEQRRTHSMAQEVEARVAALTDREREIMQHLTQGESTKIIASSLGISPKTVDNHRAKVLEKMDVDNATQLTILLGRLKHRLTADRRHPWPSICPG